MSETVLIKFTMTIEQNGEEQRIQFESKGLRTTEVLEDKLFMTLAYEEQVIDQLETIDVKWTLNPTKLTMIRKGVVKGMQTYALDHVTNGFMVHEFGKIPYDVLTTNVYYDENEIHLDYQLLINQANEGNFSMVIEMKCIEGVESDE